MKKLAHIGILMALLFFFPACGDKSVPTTPRLPAPTSSQISSIIVTSLRTKFFVGSTETFTATATMSDGRTERITSGAWSSSNQSVATVDSSGLVIIIGMGSADIIMTYSGKTGSKSIFGLADYQGTWTGTYRIDGCTSSGDFLAAGICDTFIGSEYPIDLILIQDINVVQGTVFLGSLSTTMSAFLELETDGKLTLEGQITSNPFLISVVTAFQSIVPGEITGTMSQTYTATGWTGSGQLMCSIVSLTRSSTTAGESALAGRPPVKVGTLPGLVNALRKR
jgi:hypothetical protein